jgi:protein-L-isoaspartate(D-aspartate) O-methyltransferase
MNYYPQAEPLAKRIRSASVRKAFTHTDRSRFVLPHLKTSAWSDHPLPIGGSATISQPSLVAKMTEWLELTPDCRVLEIGTGSGYQTALLAQLAAAVYTIEISKQLSQRAESRLQALGYNGIHFRISDGTRGWPDAAPFDRIIATVAFPYRPIRLLNQLSEGGICLAPVGMPSETQQLIQYQRHGASITERTRCPVRFIGLQ